MLQFSSAKESANDSQLKSRFSSHTSRLLVHSAVIFTWAEVSGSSKNLYIHEYIFVQPSEVVMYHIRSTSQYILLCKGTYVILPSKLTFHRRRGSITVKVNLSKVKPSSLFPKALSMEFGYIGVDRCPIPGICKSRTNDVCDGIVGKLDLGACRFPIDKF